MDAIKQTWQQFGTLFRGLTPSQRLTLIAVPVVLLAAFGTLVWRQGGGSDVPLSWGKVFPIDQLRAAEQTLIEAGLNDFRTEGQRIFVPAAQVEQYNAALLVDGNLPNESMSEFERQFEKSSVFSSREQLQTMKEIALRNELRAVLRAVPDIEDATVTWARSEMHRWPQRTGKVTATVSLRPRNGQSLDPPLIRSVRAAVASMIPDLNANDVTIFDQGSGTAFTADSGDPFDHQMVRWIEEHTQRYERQIASALKYIPEVIVAVSVDVENLKRQIVREQRVDKSQTVAIETEENTRSSSATERASSAEPGATSNTPRQLQTAAAPTRNTSTDQSDSVSRVVPSFTLTEKEFLTAMPQAVQVSISIPEDYYDQIALARGLDAGTDDATKAAFKAAVDQIRLDEEGKVRKTATTLIPAGSPETAVNVASVTRLPNTAPDPEVALLSRLEQAVRSWGGAIALAAFAAWALLLLSRSLKSIQAVNAAADEQQQETRGDDSTAEAAKPLASPRELLQIAVRENPEVAAAVISKWIQTVK